MPSSIRTFTCQAGITLETDNIGIESTEDLIITIVRKKEEKN